jgi:hypothetical protein
MANRQVTGTLTSGGEFTATTNLIEVIYPDGERPPVAIDIADVSGVQRAGDQVTLFRRDGRETGLRAVSVSQAAQLELLVRDVVQASVEADFARQIANLHAQGYRMVAARERMVQMVRPKRINYLLAVLLFILGVLPGIAYLLYYLSVADAHALVTIDDTGQVVIRRT